tara:strand:- start:2048 stop:2365 length:318 start_codon:yes stop_codon:yes gene_type:complete
MNGITMDEFIAGLKNNVPVLNVVVTVVIILFVTLAIGQIVVFNLNKSTKKNLRLHKAIAYLGMGAAFYALFIAPAHFTTAGWIELVLGVVGIIALGSAIHTYRKQ